MLVAVTAVAMSLGIVTEVSTGSLLRSSSRFSAVSFSREAATTLLACLSDAARRLHPSQGQQIAIESTIAAASKGQAAIVLKRAADPTLRPVICAPVRLHLLNLPPPSVTF